MEFLGSYLDGNEDDQNRNEYRASDEIAVIDHDVGLEPAHGNRVTARLSERSCEDLDEPEAESDFGNFARGRSGHRLQHEG
jgi:hypothetical protein